MNIEYVEVEGSSHSSILQLVEVSGSASEGTFRSEADALRRQRKDFTEKALDILNDLRGSGELCDAILRVDNCSFVVHRNILSASSSYFKALFTNKAFQTHEPPQLQEVQLSDVSSDIVAHLIDFAYSRQVLITSDNVESLLLAADRFLMAPLVKSCCEFLKRQLAPENCLGIAVFARTYFWSGLEKAAMQFAYHNFNDLVARSEEFLDQEVENLCELLSSDNLNVRNEELVFEASCKWVHHRELSRRQEMGRLLKTVRMGFLTIKYVVETVKPHSYVRENEEAKNLTLEVLKYLCNLNVDPRQQVQLELSFPLTRPRVPHEILFVIGGWSGGSPCNIVETYDTRADRWLVAGSADRASTTFNVALKNSQGQGVMSGDMTEPFQFLPLECSKQRLLGTHQTGPRAYHACVVIDEVIYVVGGFDGIEYFNSCRKFYPSKLLWTEAPPMNSKRCYVSAVGLKGMVYAMGGFDGHVRLNTVERLNPNTNQWSYIQPMMHQRSDAKATVLDDKIYICGGFNGQECLNTAEYYNPSTNHWTLITPMRNRRSGVGVIAYNGMIYALGGFNGITRMNTGERYSPETRSWTTIPEMFSPRSNFAIGVIDDMLFVIGGFNGVTTISHVECYDSLAGECGEWYDAAELSLYRSALSACVVANIPNVQQFVTIPSTPGTLTLNSTDSNLNMGNASSPVPLDDVPQQQNVNILNQLS